jgi:hydroxyacylglutathione hydrolase
LEIVPGIHKIDGVTGVNSYLVENDETLLVVDTGIPGNAEKIVKYIEKIGKRPSDVRYIVLTHSDIDHIGSTLELKQMTGAKVAIHASDGPVMSGRQKFKTHMTPLGPLVGFIMSLMGFHPLEPDILLGEGSEIAGWQVVHAPGHTPGCICLYIPGKAIFVGDALRTNSAGKPRPVSPRVTLDNALARKSIAKIAALDFPVLLSGHGAPMTENASEKVRNMVARIDKRAA